MVSVLRILYGVGGHIGGSGSGIGSGAAVHELAPASSHQRPASLGKDHGPNEAQIGPCGASSPAKILFNLAGRGNEQVVWEKGRCGVQRQPEPSGHYYYYYYCYCYC